MRTIIMRELFDHIKSFRWIILFILTITLFSANGLIFARKYSFQRSDYITRTTEPPFEPRSISDSDYYRYASQDIFNTNDGPNYPRPSTIATELYIPPSPLLFIAEGGDKHRPYGYDVRPAGIIIPLPEKPHNYTMPLYTEIDWSFIIKVLFSLYIILFGYDAISGEKEQGTLRLLLSNSFSRTRLLLAKYFVLMITLTIPLITGFLASVSIMLLSIPSILTSHGILRFLIVLLASFVFISLFSFLTLLITSTFRESVRGLLILILIWIFFLVFPNMANLLTEKFADISTEGVFAKQLMSRQAAYQMMFDNEFFEKESPSFRGYFDSRESAEKVIIPLIIKARKEFLNIARAYDNAMKRKLRLAHTISRLSPTSQFQYILENASGTGMRNEERFLEEAQLYSVAYDNYIKEKLGEVRMEPQTYLSAIAWGLDKEGYTYSMRFDGLTRKEVDKLNPQEYEGDKSDFPRFNEPEPDLTDALHDSLPDIAGLLLWNIVLAMGAMLAFQRADVT